MIDATCTTHDFLEGSYDIFEYLTGLKDLLDSNDVITFKWADGSISKVPSINLIRDIVGSYFNSISVGNIEMSSDGDLNIIGNLSTLLNNFSSTNTTILNSVIREITAKYVTLGNDVNVTDILNNETITSSNSVCNVINSNSVTTDTMFTDKLFLDKCLLNLGSVNIPETYTTYKSYISNFQVGGVTLETRIHLDGDLKTIKEPESMSYYSDTVKILLDGNVIGTTKTKSTYNYNSIVGSLLLYPKCGFYTSEDKRNLNIQIDYPTDAELGTFIRVYNHTKDSIKACNVWGFFSGKFQPIHYISIPPWSAIECMVAMSTGSAKYVYMLPTTIVEGYND